MPESACSLFFCGVFSPGFGGGGPGGLGGACDPRLSRLASDRLLCFFSFSFFSFRSERSLSAPSALSFPPDPVPFRCIRKVPRHLLGGFSLVHRTTVEGDGLRSMHLAKPKRNNTQSISIYILCSNRASKHIECFEIHIETKDMCQRFASTFCAHVASGITMMVVTQADTRQVPERHEGTRHTSQVCP